MKLGFNEANDRFCKNHSVMMDLELCEKYGFDCIDIQSECLNRDLEAGKITLEEMGAWFQSHHLKMLSYNALCFFNMKQTQEEKDAVMAELDEIIRRCNILGCKMIVVVPSKDMKERGLTPTRKEIREDADKSDAQTKTEIEWQIKRMLLLGLSCLQLGGSISLSPTVAEPTVGQAISY